MPTVLRVGRYRFFFYSNEGFEPAQIYVEAGDDEAKYWLEPIRIQNAHGFSERESCERSRRSSTIMEMNW